MKIGKYEIVRGPNPAFYISIFLFGCWSILAHSIWPIAIILLIYAVSIPLSFKLHDWVSKQNPKMLEDFPDDPYIQRKYAKKDGER